jgi:CHAT domain-containing protein
MDSELVVGMEPALINIPWELCYDREAGRFLCEYNMSRQIIGLEKNRQRPSAIARNKGMKMLILADLAGNLPKARQEGSELKGLLEKIAEDQALRLSVDLFHSDDFGQSPKKGPEVIKKLLAGDYDFIHYCGHAFFDKVSPQKSGWIVGEDSSDVVRSFIFKDLSKPPAMVFCNACESAEFPDAALCSSEFGYSLAGGFMNANVSIYIGNVVKVTDDSALVFAIDFYKKLFKESKSVGSSLAETRTRRIAGDGNDPSWAGYVLYGAPTFRVSTNHV